MRFVAVTSCPTGIAHTYMAAEALEQIGRTNGHEVVVETQGSIGTDAIDQTVIDAAWAASSGAVTATTAIRPLKKLVPGVPEPIRVTDPPVVATPAAPAPRAAPFRAA